MRDLQILVDRGPVTCQMIGEPDTYGRILGRCSFNGESLNEELVRRGYAVARPSETTDYVAAEAEAKDKKLGLWQGQFMQTERVSKGRRHLCGPPLSPIGTPSKRVGASSHFVAKSVSGVRNRTRLALGRHGLRMSA